MKNAIWATYSRKISTDVKPQHECPSGEDTWCSYQKAKALGTLYSYKQRNSIPVVIQTVIEPVYDRLTDADLLERCLEGYTENNNECLNAVIWSITNVLYGGAKIVEIVTYLIINTSIFNGRKNK